MVLLKKDSPKQRIGSVPPPFKLADLKAAIPASCFERSLLRSTLYLVVDLVIAFSIHYFLSGLPSLLPAPFSWLAWALYAVIQGSAFTALWVVAHEAGHQAYSKYGLVNDIVGFVVHTCLLVPYFSWKISHAHHHAKTSSMEHDEVFVPKEQKDVSDHPLLHTAPLRLLQVVVMLVFGWPWYLAFNVTAHKTPDFVSHYWPYCSLFSKKEQFLVILSDLGLVAWGLVLYKLVQMSSLSWMCLVYGIPMIVCNAWLVGITALHHTNKDVPHYGAKEWTWLRGALGTVDRDYGIWNVWHHHIGDTHVAHHLFSSMPHYHAQEATEAIKKVLGEYYLYDNTNILVAMWQNTLECFSVEEQDGIFWWRRSPLVSQAEKQK